VIVMLAAGLHGLTERPAAPFLHPATFRPLSCPPQRPPLPPAPGV